MPANLSVDRKFDSDISVNEMKKDIYSLRIEEYMMSSNKQRTNDLGITPAFGTQNYWKPIIEVNHESKKNSIYFTYCCFVDYNI